MAYSTLLDELDAPTLRAYPKATVVAADVGLLEIVRFLRSRLPQLGIT